MIVGLYARLLKADEGREIPYYERKDNVLKQKGMMCYSPKDPQRTEKKELDAFKVACDMFAAQINRNMANQKSDPGNPPPPYTADTSTEEIKKVLEGSYYHSIWLYPNKGWALKWALEEYHRWARSLYGPSDVWKTGEKYASGKHKGMVSLNRIVFLDGDKLFFCQEGTDHFATNETQVRERNSYRYILRDSTGRRLPRGADWRERNDAMAILDSKYEY